MYAPPIAITANVGNCHREKLSECPTLMTHIFVLTAGALLPALFALYDIRETWIWRGSGVLFALPMLSLQVTYPRRRRKVVGNGPPPAVFVVFGSALTLAMLGYVLV